MPKSTRIEQKQKAQEMLMSGLGNVLGYWFENQADEAEKLGLTESEFAEVLQIQADRVAKMFGYDKAWGN